MNKIILTGRLVGDPEISPDHADDPKRMHCSFRIAVKRDYRKGGSQDTDFFHCTAFGQTATYLVRYGMKGKRIQLEGRVEVRRVDNDNGSRSVYPQVIVRDLWILDYPPGIGPASMAPPYDPSEDPGFFESIPDPDQVPFLARN